MPGGKTEVSAKCALVVDDSKSARTFLAKMLEKYELDVVSVESAEQAIEYLGHHRPDVIFMDHLMPGMDGFQAVQTIKNNPRTATIPIMMYTSQEGELYVGQARALGAVGVLPKQIKPADVSKVLYQLHLLPDRRTGEQSTFRAAGVGGLEIEDADSRPPESYQGGAAARHSNGAPRPLTEAALREQIGELRRSFGAALENHMERLKSELHATARDFSRTDVFSTAVEAPSKRSRMWIGIAAALAGIIAVASLVIAAQQAAHTRTLADQVAALRTALSSLERERGTAGAPRTRSPAAVPADSVSRAETPGDSAVAASNQDGAPAVSGVAFRRGASTRPLIEVVPYGEDPFSGPRLDSFRQLFDRLAAQGYRGIVEIKEYPGRFCLMGNENDGYALAPDETAYARCDLIGDTLPQDDDGAPRVSVAFADLAAALRSSSHGSIDVQVAAGDDKSTLVAYPPVSDSLTAGEWNRAAGANNRIEIRLR